MLTKDNIDIIRDFSNIYDEFITIYTQVAQDNKTLISKISHEIKNPLTLIRSMFQLTGNQFPEVKESYYWECIFNELDYINNILNNLSSFSDSSIVHKKPIRINTIIQDICTSFTSIAKEQNKTLEYKISKRLPIVNGDELKLKRAIMNIVKNAFEATPINGTIKVIARNSGKYVCIIISDTGVGIENSRLNDIFQPFITSKPSGTGLGLSIVQNIIKEHEGTINVTSEIDEGTSFVVRIPAYINNEDVNKV